MKIYFFSFFLFGSFFLWGQSTARIESILNTKRTQIAQVETGPASTILYLPCPFSESSFNVGPSPENIGELTVVKIYYVYTRYKQSSSFNQSALDQKRFEWLNATYPTLLADPLIEWEIIEQTGCTDYTQGDSYFHGFILVHRPIAGPESREDELKRINAYLQNPTDLFYEPNIDPISGQLPTDATKTSATTVQTTNTSKKAEFADGEFALYKHFQTSLVNSENVPQQRIDKWISVSFTVSADGKTDSLVFKENYAEAAKDQVQNAFLKMQAWTPAYENGKAVKSTVNLEIRVSYSGDVKGMYSRDGIKPTFSNEKTDVPELSDDHGINLLVNSEPISIKSSAVYKGLELTRSFKNTALVMDVTGSMTTHIAALINWVKTNKLAAPFTSYTFFNDGDAKTTKQKKVGETGGIYLTQNLDEVDKVIEEAMRKGNGGEAPENDMEAVSYAFQNDEDANAVLLIADNYSEVRDIELLKNISRPVHVLLCAAPKFVRCEYLKIAKDTGGMFFLNGEKTDLSQIQKGDIVVLQKVEYKYNGSDFEILHKGEINY
ncbi:MAG: hypothetical protein HYZ14_12830 [Bacteroidetes bacterium]|nr:hypothetical protein [Bacteroidota bacterium]